MSPNGHACRIRSPDLYHFDKEVKRGRIKRGTYCKIDKLNNVFPSAGHKCQKGSFNRVRPEIEREIENNFQQLSLAKMHNHTFVVEFLAFLWISVRYIHCSLN